MKALQISKFGKPHEVIEVIEIDDPASPSANEVILAVEYAAISPAELLMIRGLYGVKPPLPAALGGEGVGRVLATGSAVSNVKVGDRVAIPLAQPVWREQLTVPAAGLLVLPTEADAQQLSMLRVNPLTAALLLTEYVKLAPGDWVVQNGGNSGVGRAVIAFAKDMGLRTVSLVRRPELIEELKAAGADIVLLDGPSVAKEIAEATGRAKILLGFDGVAGDSAHSVASSLAWGGKLVAYGGTSGKPALASPLNIIFKNITLSGFWLGYPHFSNAHDKLAKHLHTAVRLIAEGKLHVPVAGVFGLSQAAEALAHAQQGGKVLFKPS